MLLGPLRLKESRFVRPMGQKSRILGGVTLKSFAVSEHVVWAVGIKTGVPRHQIFLGSHNNPELPGYSLRNSGGRARGSPVGPSTELPRTEARLAS